MTPDSLIVVGQTETIYGEISPQRPADLHRSFNPAVGGLVLALACWAVPGPAPAAETYHSGALNNITSTASGLMVMLDTGLPDNCAGTPYGWMLIPELNKTMIATALLMWATGSRLVTIYTTPNPGGYCIVNQLDPV